MNIIEVLTCRSSLFNGNTDSRPYIYALNFTMKFPTLIKFLFLLLPALAAKYSSAQNPVNWTADQLIQPAQLAAVLKSDKNIPVLLSIGPGAIIPHSKQIGMVRDEENMEAFKKHLKDLPRDTAIVIYCGCCPYEHCPNVRPAIQTLKEMKFTRFRLLDLPHNIKTDWIDKGYPTVH